jgi:hypothetical protein
MLKYVAMELAEGKLPDGKQYVAKQPLLERRVAQVPIGKDVTYGMGLEVDTTYKVAVVHHGGDMIGFHSDMMGCRSERRRGDPDELDPLVDSLVEFRAQAARGAVRWPRRPMRS